MSVIQRGTDSSGRPIRSSPACWAEFDAVCDELGFVPTIVQGGYVGSGGAAASADTHAGDAFDVRLWDRTADERAAMIRVFRAHAFAYWERYPSQGFDLHAHIVPGPWGSPAPQALDQWHDYLAGRNGLASNGADYHPRPDPLVLTPVEDDMYSDDDRKQAAQTAADLAKLTKRFDRFADNSWRREAALAKALKDQGVDVDAILAKVTES